MKRFLIISLLIALCGFQPSALGAYDKYFNEMQVATKLLNQGKTQQAKAVYNALLRKSPKYYPAKLGLGNIYTRQFNFVAAEKEILKAINTGANNANAYERLANNYYQWANADENSRDFLLGKANGAINKALSLDKNNSNVYSTYALICIENKEYEKALQSLHTAVNLNSQNQEAYVNMGILYTKLQKYDLAQNKLERAVNINPSTPDPYKQYGIMLAEAKQYRQAVDYLEKSRFYDIYTSYKDHFLLANLYEKVGKLKESIDEYYATLKLKPDFTDCYTQIARLFGDLGDENKSIDVYKIAVAEDYSILQSMITSAQNYLRDKDFIASRPLFIKVLKIEPGNSYAFDGLCNYYYLQSIENGIDIEKWNKDRLFLEEQIKSMPSDNYLAQVSWQKFQMARDGLTGTIAQNLSNIASITPEKAEDYAAIGEAFFLQNYFNEANNNFNEAIDKYVSYYSSKDSPKKAGEELLYLADRLASDHEMIASRKIYDKVIELTSSNLAVDGLTVLAKTQETADFMFSNANNIGKKEYYTLELIKNLQETVKYYPQDTEAHYLLQEAYAKIGYYQMALEEMKIYVNLAQFNNFNGAPKPEQIRGLTEKYLNSMINNPEIKLSKEEVLKEIEEARQKYKKQDKQEKQNKQDKQETQKEILQ